MVYAQMMKYRYTFSFGLLLWLFLSMACAPLYSKKSQQDNTHDILPTYALQGVHLIPIVPEGVLKNQTLLVRNQRIIAMGDANSVQVPADAIRLNVKNKFVMPGLSDMHVHLDGEGDLLLMLRHGVTRVRNMSENAKVARMAGSPVMPVLKKKVQAREIPGPMLYNCGPILDGSPPKHALTRVIETTEEAQAAVKYTVEKGFDCLKVYDHLSIDRFKDIVQLARQVRLPVLGHVPDAVGWRRAIETMKSIEHLSGYINSNTAQYRVPPDDWDTALKETARTGVFHCPTIALWAEHAPYNNFAKVKNNPRYDNVPPMTKLLWEASAQRFYDMEYPDKAGYQARMVSLAQKLSKTMHQHGVKLLIGTDTNMAGVFPGISTLKEMGLFVEAGISTQETLKIATWNAADFFGDTAQRGSLAVGKQADLVVLDKNPLVNMQHIESTAGVMAQGKWWSREALDQEIASVLSSAF